MWAMRSENSYCILCVRSGSLAVLVLGVVLHVAILCQHVARRYLVLGRTKLTQIMPGLRGVEWDGSDATRTKCCCHIENAESHDMLVVYLCYPVLAAPRLPLPSAA